MDMLVLGEFIRGKSPNVYYGYWMPAAGNTGIGAIDVLFNSANSKFTVKMQTKNAQDIDPIAANGIIGSVSLSTTGVNKFDATNAKEWVRYLITADDVTNEQYMHFQFLQPQWDPN
jgi:hypothetical protein